MIRFSGVPVYIQDTPGGILIHGTGHTLVLAGTVTMDGTGTGALDILITTDGIIHIMHGTAIITDTGMAIGMVTGMDTMAIITAEMQIPITTDQEHHSVLQVVQQQEPLVICMSKESEQQIQD